MDSRAFSLEGYIINQTLTGDVPYGWMKSSSHGCGWIAAYNFLKATGRPQPPERLAALLGNASPLKSLLGTGPLRLQRFLEGCGCSLTTAATRRRIFQLAPRAKAGILLYNTGRSGHFVCFVPQSGGLLHFYNARQGDPAYLTTMEDFYKANVKLPATYLMEEI